MFLDPNVPQSKNVFGLPNTYEKPEYRVEKGHSVNCMSIAVCAHAGMDITYNCSLVKC